MKYAACNCISQHCIKLDELDEKLDEKFDKITDENLPN